MKKAIVLLLALVVVGAFAFAQDAEAPAKDAPRYELTASATAEWFYDLEASNSGFANSYDLSFKYYLLNDITTSKGGEGTYGQIDVEHLNLVIAEETEETADNVTTWRDQSYDDDGLSVSAKIVFMGGNAWVGIYGGPSADYDNAVYVPLFSEDAGYATDSSLNPLITPDAGITVGYKFGTLGQIVLGVASKAKSAAVDAADATQVVVVGTGLEVVETGVTYTRIDTGAADVAPLVAGDAYVKTTAAVVAVPADKNYYLGGVDVTLTPMEGVAIDAGLWYDPEVKQTAITAKAALTFGALSFSAAMDAWKNDTADLEWDFSAHAGYSLNEAKDSINFDAYYMKDVSNLDIGLKFVDAEGFVPGLAFSFGVFAMDLMADPAWDPMFLSIAQSASFAAGAFKPYEALRYDLNPEGQLYLNLGVEYSGIANTVIKADYAMGGALDDNNVNLADSLTDASVFTLSATVSL